MLVIIDFIIISIDIAINVINLRENTDNIEEDEEIDNPLDYIDDEGVVVEELEEEDNVGVCKIEEDEEIDYPLDYIGDEGEVVEDVVVVSSTVDHIDSTRIFIDRKLITILSLLSIVFCILVGRLFIPPHLIARNNFNSNEVQLPVALINTTSFTVSS